jgi:hypothetical protein
LALLADSSQSACLLLFISAVSAGLEKENLNRKHPPDRVSKLMEREEWKLRDWAW